jgi:phosphatidylglycerophosphate synthase
MRRVARGLNYVSGGRLHPNVVTFLSLLGHLPVAWFITEGKLELAALCLVGFGLLDALDGELARLQKRANPTGMLLDATTDRMKEVILYTGVAYAITAGERPVMAAWAVAACGGSLLVSYVKAKGETAVASSGLDHATINRLFQDGLARYEIRMFILLIGLLSDRIILAVIAIAILSWFTAFERLFKISRNLKSG